MMTLIATMLTAAVGLASAQNGPPQGQFGRPASASASEPGEFLLVRRPLEVVPIRLAAINDHSLVYLRDDKGWVTVELSECIALLNADASEPRSATRARGMLMLADGQRLPGDAVAGVKPANDAFAWNHPWLGRMDVPLDLIATVALRPGMLPPPPGIRDVVLLANGDRQEGLIVGMGDPLAIEVESALPPGGSAEPTAPGAPGATIIEIPLDRIAAIAMINPKKPASGRRVWFEEGTVLDIQSINVGDDGYVKLTGPMLASGTQPTRVGLSQIAAVLLDHKALLPLAELAPSRVEGPPTRYVLPRPELLDADAPLDLSRIELRGPIVVRYALPAGCTRFTAQAEMPRASQAWGDCELIVRLDDAVAFTQTLNAANPRALVNIPVTGRELTIELGPGAHGAIQDRVVLSRAMLLKK